MEEIEYTVLSLYDARIAAAAPYEPKPPAS